MTRISMIKILPPFDTLGDLYDFINHFKYKVIRVNLEDVADKFIAISLNDSRPYHERVAYSSNRKQPDDNSDDWWRVRSIGDSMLGLIQQILNANYVDPEEMMIWVEDLFFK